MFANFPDNIMQMLFKGFPENCDRLKFLRDGAFASGSSSRWSSEWEAHALPLIREVSFYIDFDKDM